MLVNEDWRHVSERRLTMLVDEMTKLDRVGKSDNFNFRGVSSFLLVCEKRSQAARKGMECLHSDGIAKVWVLDNKYVLLTKIKL